MENSKIPFPNFPFARQHKGKRSNGVVHKGRRGIQPSSPSRWRCSAAPQTQGLKHRRADCVNKFENTRLTAGAGVIRTPWCLRVVINTGCPISTHGEFLFFLFFLCHAPGDKGSCVVLYRRFSDTPCGSISCLVVFNILLLCFRKSHVICAQGISRDIVGFALN